LEVEWVRATPSLSVSVSVFQHGVGGYAGSVDATIVQSRPTGGFAAAAVAWVASSPGRQQVAMLRFDAVFGSGVGQVPAGSVILSAKLVLTTPAIVAGADGGGGSLVRLRKPFMATPTWASAFGGNGVQPDGIEANLAADRVLGAIAQGIHVFDVTMSVQAWAGGTPNHGWAVVGGTTDAWGFSTAEATALGERLASARAARPELTVTIRGERAVPHGRMAEIYEACRAAGVTHVAISVQPRSRGVTR
jgi:hypothetical protein